MNYAVLSINYYKHSVGENHRLVANVMLDYGAMEVDRKNYEKAIELLNETGSILNELPDRSEEKISTVNALLAEIESAN